MEANCEYCSKRSFESQGAAATGMKALLGRNSSALAMNVYRCAFGRGWHFGHKRESLRRERVRKRSARLTETKDHIADHRLSRFALAKHWEMK